MGLSWGQPLFALSGVLSLQVFCQGEAKRAADTAYEGDEGNGPQAVRNGAKRRKS